MESVTLGRICIGFVFVLGGLFMPFVGLHLMIFIEEMLYTHDRAVELAMVRRNPQAYCTPTVQGTMYVTDNFVFQAWEVIYSSSYYNVVELTVTAINRLEEINKDLRQ